MKNYITTIPDSNNVTTDKLFSWFKIYYYTRLIFMVIIVIIGICICVAINGVTNELQHLVFHMTDGTCCNLYH